MSIIYNGTTIKKLIYNDTNIQNGYYGSTKVFSGNDTWKRYYVNYNWGKYNCNKTYVYGYIYLYDRSYRTYSGNASDIYFSASSQCRCYNSVLSYNYGSPSDALDTTTGYFDTGNHSSNNIDASRYNGVCAALGNLLHNDMFCVISNISPAAAAEKLQWEYSSGLKVRANSKTFSYTVTVYQSHIDSTTYSKGDYIEDVSSTNSSAYPTDGADDSHTYWYVYTTTSCGSYIDSVEAEPGTYPDNGIQNGYWYIKQ